MSIFFNLERLGCLRLHGNPKCQNFQLNCQLLHGSCTTETNYNQNFKQSVKRANEVFINQKKVETLPLICSIKCPVYSFITNLPKTRARESSP